MDVLQELRRKVLLPALAANMSGVELGAFARPTILPSEARMQFADYYSTAQLREQAQRLQINPDDVVDVTYVLENRSLEDVLLEPVDFIIANHVVEHLIDPLRWVKNLERVLKPNGFVFITLPDKKYSFDKFRPDTSLAHFILDLLNGGEATLQEHCIEAGLFYDKNYVGQPQEAAVRLTLEAITSFSKGWHPGMHVHVFQAETFKNRVLEPLLHLGHLDYSLETYVNNRNIGEFSFVLRKGIRMEGWRPDCLYKPAYDSQLAEAAEDPSRRA